MPRESLIVDEPDPLETSQHLRSQLTLETAPTQNLGEFAAASSFSSQCA